VLAAYGWSENKLLKQELSTQAQQGLEVDLPLKNQSKIDSKTPLACHAS
jgi:hypothetical protein